MSNGAATGMILRRRHGRTIHKLDRRVREMRDLLTDKHRPFAEELEQVKTERSKALEFLLKANHVITQLPDATERKTVAAMGILSRLRWALGVAITGRFRWEREGSR